MSTWYTHTLVSLVECVHLLLQPTCRVLGLRRRAERNRNMHICTRKDSHSYMSVQDCTQTHLVILTQPGILSHVTLGHVQRMCLTSMACTSARDLNTMSSCRDVLSAEERARALAASSAAAARARSAASAPAAASCSLILQGKVQEEK